MRHVMDATTNEFRSMISIFRTDGTGTFPHEPKQIHDLWVREIDCWARDIKEENSSPPVLIGSSLIRLIWQNR